MESLEKYINISLKRFFEFPEIYNIQLVNDKLIFTGSLLESKLPQLLPHYEKLFNENIGKELIFMGYRPIKIDYSSNNIIIQLDDYNYLNILPEELIFNIFKYLNSPKELDNLINSNISLFKILSDDIKWKSIRIQNYPNCKLKIQLKLYFNYLLCSFSHLYKCGGGDPYIKQYMSVNISNIDKIVQHSSGTYILSEGRIYFNGKLLFVDYGIIIQISSSASHVAFINSAGQLYTFGLGNHGQLGHGNNSSKIIPALIVGNYGIIVQISCGSYHTGFINSNGELYTFGYNRYGQLGHGDYTDRLIPTKVIVSDIVKHISCGNINTLFSTSSNNVYIMGDDIYEEIDISLRVFAGPSPLIIHHNYDDEIAQLSLGHDHIAILDSKGKLYTFGNNHRGQLGHGDRNFRNFPEKISENYGQIIQISCGLYHTGFINSLGEVYTFGENVYGQLGHGDFTAKLIPTQIKNFIASEILCVMVSTFLNGTFIN